MPRALPAVLALLGVAALALAVARGEARVALVLVVPVVHGSGPFAFAGVLLLAAAAVAWFSTAARFARASNAPPEATEEAPRVRFAGVGLVGPIPVGWGSDRAALLAALVAALLLAALAFVIFSR